MIEKKWKWVAKDSDGGIYAFTNKPLMRGSMPIWQSEGDYIRCNNLFVICGDWNDSLHKIIHHEDGKIEFRKPRPDLKVDDPVYVRMKEDQDWKPRYFYSWTEDGHIRTFDGGQTSFTSTGDTSPWAHYKLP